jgi:UV DNA damage endonuclease
MAGKSSTISKVRSAKPRLGLVCLTIGPEVRFKTITRARFLALPAPEQAPKLRDLYAQNMAVLFNALQFCAKHKIFLYRMPSEPFPMSEHSTGKKVLLEMNELLATFGPQAEQLGIRVLMHPDQFVVLNSLSPHVVTQSVGILERYGFIFDLLKLPRSTWAPFIIHGGKTGRPDELVSVIQDLPATIRARLVLENDERAYSAREILDICQRAGVPMVFDPHHHIVKEKLDSYEHTSIADMVRKSRDTWPHPEWQLAHISNGREFFGDPRHSDLINTMPTALLTVPWVEVEAKAKEEAIFQMRIRFPELAGS